MYTTSADFDRAAFFRGLRRERERQSREALENLRPAEVISKGKEVPISTLGGKRSALGKMAHLAVDFGWEVKVGQSEYFTGDTLQKNGKVKLGKTGTHRWFEAVKNRIKIKMTAPIDSLGPIIKVGEHHVDIGMFEGVIRSGEWPGDGD
jgi:hypothetical protein